MTERAARRPSRDAQRSKPEPDKLGPAEYASLVLLLAAALVGTAMLISWLAESRGILAPGSSVLPRSTPPDAELYPDLNGDDDGFGAPGEQ